MSTDIVIRPTLSAATRTFLAHRGLVALSVLAIGVAALLRISFLQLAVSAYAQFELTYQSLADDDLLAPGYGRRRFLAVVGLQIVLSIIVIVGLLVFVLPGIYLFIRLYLALPALIAEEAGVFEAIRISWQRTARQEIALLALIVIAVVPAIGLWAIFFMCIAGDAGTWAVVVSTFTALIGTGLTLVFGWFLAAAAYAATRGDSSRLQEVFA